MTTGMGVLRVFFAQPARNARNARNAGLTDLLGGLALLPRVLKLYVCSAVFIQLRHIYTPLPYVLDQAHI